MTILEQIVEHKRDEISQRKQRVKVSHLIDSEFFERKSVSLIDSLNHHPVFGIIAEIKRASPSAGVLKSNANLLDIAREYEEHGAAAISVLTDERFFSGSLDDLSNVRQKAKLPLLRKDFILDEYQIFEAKSAGADAILLIAAILEKSQLSDLHSAANELGLETLVELYEKQELDKLDFDRMNFIGVNNRNLHTFAIDLNHSLEMLALFPREVTLVSESGIHTVDDLKKLYDHGIHAALIGEMLMKAEQPGTTLTNLLAGLKRETAS